MTNGVNGASVSFGKKGLFIKLGTSKHKDMSLKCIQCNVKLDLCVFVHAVLVLAKLSSMCSVNPATSFLCPAQYHHQPRIS